MSLSDVTGLEQLFLSGYVIAHGLIHLIFLFNFHDEEKDVYTGWSGRSWLLDKVIPQKITSYIGKIMWILIALLFVVSGLTILDLLTIDEYLPPLVIIASAIAILAFIFFYDGLSPTPLHWILGVVIDLVLIAFVVIFPNEILILLALLILIWLYGMFVHTKIIPDATSR